ncbi:hypothetical protein LEMLEM_LOCUS1122 [Lemmus lemmus]
MIKRKREKSASCFCLSSQGCKSSHRHLIFGLLTPKTSRYQPLKENRAIDTTD